MKPPNAEPAKLYEVDFCEWTRRTATLLREKRFDELQLIELAEEVADLGKRDRREARSRMIVLLMHLLKWNVQPDLRPACAPPPWITAGGPSRWLLTGGKAMSGSTRHAIQEA